MKPTFYIIATILPFLLGCKSPYTIHQRYAYEGVYKHNQDIYIGSEKIDRSEDKERIWILSDATLTYLLDQAKQSVK